MFETLDRNTTFNLKERSHRLLVKFSLNFSYSSFAVRFNFLHSFMVYFTLDNCVNYT